MALRLETKCARWLAERLRGYAVAGREAAWLCHGWQRGCVAVRTYPFTNGRVSLSLALSRCVLWKVEGVFMLCRLLRILGEEGRLQ